MRKLLAYSMVLIGAAVSVQAGNVAPEIDPSSGVAALALLSGGLLVLRARRKK